MGLALGSCHLPGRSDSFPEQRVQEHVSDPQTVNPWEEKAVTRVPRGKWKLGTTGVTAALGQTLLTTSRGKTGRIQHSHKNCECGKKMGVGHGSPVLPGTWQIPGF